MVQDKLPNDWLTGGLLDAEYKQYILLAWLKRWEREFRDVKIYPALGHFCLLYTSPSPRDRG